MARCKMYPPEASALKIHHDQNPGGVQNLCEISLSLMVFEINNIFHFRQIFKMAAESWKGKKVFLQVPKEYFLVPCGQTFA